jgi:very-short-patch-repair endonuclease
VPSDLDARRDRVIARRGYRVLRLEADAVLRNLPEALARIRAALRL